jgi:hypothetical protein
MKIQTPFTAKRILAIVLGIVILGFLAIMLFSPSNVKDTAGQTWMMSGVMLALSIGLIYYGLIGGKEPEVGMIQKSNKDAKDDQ